MQRLAILILALFSWSCQEEVFLTVGKKAERVPVIEAIWTNQGIFNEVKISYTKDYYDTSLYEPITDAQVLISVPGTLRRIPFRYNPQTRSYKPQNPAIVGRIGDTYELTVNWYGNVFKSSGELLAPPLVDSVTYSFQEKRLFRDEGYYIKVYGKIPFTENNNYRIRVIENDTLKNQRDDYLLFDDTFGLTFFEQGLELGYAFQENDRVRLELFRLNKDAYTYLNQLVNLLFNDGGLFSPPPQNPETNIKVVEGDSEVFGYFLVSPVLTRLVVIEPKN
jgi:hypothetical protein